MKVFAFYFALSLIFLGIEIRTQPSSDESPHKTILPSSMKILIEILLINKILIESLLEKTMSSLFFIKSINFMKNSNLSINSIKLSLKLEMIPLNLMKLSRNLFVCIFMIEC